jgi:hypothetical protein
MLHLFNKTYLEFDDKIEINFDRVVISDRYGLPMHQELDKVAYGELISYHKDITDISKAFGDFIASLHAHGETTNKKIIVYCDKESYVKFLSLWFTAVCPKLDLPSFKQLVDLTIYKERIVSNTQLGSVTGLDMQTLWAGLGDITAAWDSAKVSKAQVQNIKDLNLNFSYEFLIAEYLSGSDNHLEKLLKTHHLFLRRWFQECFTDNRQMVMLNLLNHKMQTALGFDIADVDITKANLLADIEPLKFYGDEDIWDMTTDLSSGVYGVVKLTGLPQDKIDGLRDTILNVYGKFEDMPTNYTCFSAFQWLEKACKTSMTKAEMDEVLDFVINDPFDTCLVPRFDFQNVNFPLLIYFLRLKKDKKESSLAKFQLI